MSDLFASVDLLAIVLAGRKPKWSRQATTFTGAGTPAGASTPAPSRTTDGIILENSPATLVTVDFRELLTVRECRIKVTTTDLTGTYRTIVDGNTFDFVAAQGNLNDLVIAWRNALVADAPTFAIVNITTESSTGAPSTDDTLVLKSKTFPAPTEDYSLFIDTPVGTAVLEGAFEAVSGVARVYVTYRPKDPAKDPVALWREIDDGPFNIDPSGFIYRFDSAGTERGYVQLTEVRGGPDDGAGTTVNANVFNYAHRVAIGPAVLETATAAV